ncbi:substrate-binding domain-containing protein [Streptomyces sp. NPDC002838]|uniref:substrate-binding domain-containing protein n=1 Tax=Streptomyces sp. NPDC002838 TaxID=3154436 RepID=UPI003329F10F
MIFTAIRVEYEKVEARLTKAGATPLGSETLDGSTVAAVYELGGRVPWRVYLAETGPGNTTATAVVARCLERVRPEAAFFVGIAAGRKDAGPGDVVVAKYVDEYQRGKRSEWGFHARPEGLKPPPDTVSTAAQVARELDRTELITYTIHFKPIVSGDVVIDSLDASDHHIISTHYENAAAIETEGAGFAAAVHGYTATRLQWLLIRGISDLADGNKKFLDAARSQERAALNAAQVAIATLLALSPEESEESGRSAPAPSPLRQEVSESPLGTKPEGRPGRASPPGRMPVLVGAGRRRWLWAAPPLALATALVLVLQSCGSGDPGTLPKCDHADTTLRIAASVDKSEPMRRAAKAYGNRVSDGTCVRIEVQDRNSGEAMRALVGGWKETKPDVWAPAGNTWLALARATATGKNKEQFPERAESIVQSPLTIAMPKPMAEALDWPEPRFTWSHLADWANNADGFWAKRGKPEWGDFKLGKTNPGYSTSGLNATVGAFYAATGTSRELSITHLDKSGNRSFVKSIEQAAVHYGETTLTFLSNLRQADRNSPEQAMSYISAVTLEESTVAAYNAGYPCGALNPEKVCAKTSPPDTPLVSFYPKDGVPFSDHPYIELNGMSPAKKAVSRSFLQYLHSPEVHAKQFAPYGFRTHQGTIPTDSPLRGKTSGVLPQEVFTRMPMPRGDVLDHLMEIWPTLRRHANVRILIDTSESMSDEIPGTGDTKMERLKQAESELFGEFTGTDRVGLWKFSDAEVLGGEHDYKELVPLGPFEQKLAGGTRSDLLSDNFKSLEPEGATGLYDTLDAATAAMRQDYDPKAINAIVLLTDGRNEDNGSLAKEELLERISDPTKPNVRVFTIAYGNAADENDKNGRTVLQEIAEAGGGRMYDAKKAETIEQVITSVISNF